MGRLSKKVPSFTDEAIRKLFHNNSVIEILFLDRRQELRHLYEAFHNTKNYDIRVSAKFMHNDIIDNPKCVITITDSKAIARNKYSNKLVISTKVLKDIDISNIRQDCHELPLEYNLFDLPDYQTNKTE